MIKNVHFNVDIYTNTLSEPNINIRIVILKNKKMKNLNI